MVVTLRQTLILATALLVAGATMANEPPPRAEAREMSNVREVRELRDSVRRVERDTGGSVLRAERVHGREVHRVKVLTPEGRVRVVHENQNRTRETDRTTRRGAPGRDD